MSLGVVGSLNSASWMHVARLGPCKGVKTKALWVHETQYPEPILHRQALTCQLVTFAHALPSLLQHSNCSWKVQNVPALCLVKFRHCGFVQSCPMKHVWYGTCGDLMVLPARSVADVASAFSENFIKEKTLLNENKKSNLESRSRQGVRET